MKNEIKVALTIFGAIFVAFLGYRFMADIPMFSSTYVLHAHYEQVDGIIVGSSVMMQGVKIGTVNSISFLENDSIRVNFNISGVRAVPEGSVAFIRSVGLLEKGVIIERSGQMGTLESGSRIKGVYDEGFMGSLEELGREAGPNIKESTESLNSLLKQVDQMLKEGGRSDIEQSLSGLNRTINHIESLFSSKQTEIEEAITHLKNSMQNIEGLTEGQEEVIENMLSNLESSSRQIDELSGEMNKASQTLNNVLLKIDEGEGSLGLFINDPSLYNNLDSLSYNLSRLVKDLNENPRHFLKHVRLIDIF